MKQLVFTTALVILLCAATMAQQVSGTVTDKTGKPLDGATVTLIKAKDDAIVKRTASKMGKFEFAAFEADSFRVLVSYTGFESANSPVFFAGKDAVVLAPIHLVEISAALQTVVVTARKPMVEVKADKTIVNVEGTVNAIGSNGLDLLRKSPGVVVDNDDQLSLNGKTGVQVYIDGKPSPLSSQDLANYLKSLNSAQVEAIELIHNPTAQYEAAGTAGIINIRLKKNKFKGFTGTITAGMSSGHYTRFEQGLSISYRNNRINLFGMYNGNAGSTGMDFNLYRVIRDTAFDQKSKLEFKNRNQSFKAGLDYTISKKSSMGVLLNGSLATPTLENFTRTPILSLSNSKAVRILNAANINDMDNRNLNTNLWYSYKDSVGRSLMVNADHGYYKLQQEQWQPNQYWDAEEKEPLHTINYRMESPTTISIYSLKADYEQALGKGHLGLGGKIGYVNTDNIFDQYRGSGEQLNWDSAGSSRFKYTETINALYAKYSREFTRYGIQAGLRMEHTSWETELSGTGRERRNYLDFFPTLSINYTASSTHKLVLAYNRRIDRPVYKDLNPFEYRINEYTFHRGSTNLQPQYSNTISLTHTFKQRLNTSLSYSHISDVIGQVVDTASGTKGFLSKRNLSTQNLVNLNISFPFQYKAYSLYVNLNSYYTQFRASYGEGRAINLNRWASNIVLQNTIRLGKGWNAELSGFYSTPSIWQGSMKADAIWSMDAGLQKQMMKGKMSIRASVSDLFNTLKFKAQSDFAGQQIWVMGKQETRQFKLSLSYRFGNNKLKALRQNLGGAEEESKRVQSSGLLH